MDVTMQVVAVAAGLAGLWALYGLTVAAGRALRRRTDDAEDRRLRALYGEDGRR